MPHFIYIYIYLFVFCKNYCYMEFNSNTELLIFSNFSYQQMCIGLHVEGPCHLFGLVAKDVQNTREIPMLDILMKI